jgi:dienelactone hydrolase
MFARAAAILALAMPGTPVSHQLSTAAAPQAGALPGDAPIEAYLRRLTQEVSGRFLDGARTLDEWQTRRPRLRQEYFDMLGLWPLPERTPLHATVTGTVRRGDVVIEKLHYQSRPGLYVTGNLYRPVKFSGRLPAILYVCGHSGRGRDGNKTAFQDHGMWFARHGYVCLVVDSLQLGEVAGVHHGTYNLGRWWWQARGYTPAGVECWNGVRGLDYLVSRSDVDPDRLGVTGISGGGAATVWIAAADERVKVAAPVSGMSDLECYVSHKVINGHCDCMYLVNSYGWEWATIAALIAPRPLLFANSDDDPIFPMDGNRRIIARLRRVYHLYGKPGMVDDHVSKGGHAYRPDLRLAVFRWINKHLRNDTGPVEDVSDAPLPGPELRVFSRDSDIPADALNGRIDERFVPRPVVKLPERAGLERWRGAMLRELRQQCFRTFPARFPNAVPSDRTLPGMKGLLLTTEPGIEVFLSDRVDAHATDRQHGLLVVLDEAEEAGSGLPEWVRPLVRRRTVRVLAPRGCGPLRWTRNSPPNYVERAHALLGRTVDEGRVFDVASVIGWLNGQPGGRREWALAGRGRAGILAAYAALLEPTVAEVACVEPPTSHRDGPVFLNVLRVLDVPEALGLLVPRPLTLVGATGRAFDRTARLYELAGAASRLRRD